MAEGGHCTLILDNEGIPSLQTDELAKMLESSDDVVKITALKQIICGIVNGENYSRLMMPVIKFCLRSENHLIKKLLQLYWECVEKKQPSGKLLPEMILVCNALLNDLSHPNEYIRGSCLRLLCRLHERDILEQLVPQVTANLEHRHSYVRKNAVLTIFRICQAYPELIPDAGHLVEQFIAAEANISAKRNAFLMLFHCDQPRAVNFLNDVVEQISSLGESFQMIVLELVRKVVRANPQARRYYIKCVYSLLSSNSNTVAYEAANTLLKLAPQVDTAIKASVRALTTILQTESDHNVKLVLLNRLSQLSVVHKRTLQQAVMDVLRTLSSPNIDLREKTLELCLNLTNTQNIEDVIKNLKKEIINSENSDDAQAARYRTILVQTVYQCAVRFPHVASSVVHLLMNFVGDSNVSSARDVVYFVREILEQYPEIRDSVVQKLLDNFTEIRSSSVFRVALWILGEYATSADSIDGAFQSIYDSVGELPLLQPVSKPEDNSDKPQNGDATPVAAAGGITTRTVVLADGTYAQQSTLVDDAPLPSAPGAIDDSVTLRTLILNGGYFLASVVSSTFTKLALRYVTCHGMGPGTNKTLAKAALFMTSFLQAGKSVQAKKSMNADAKERILLCLRTLLNPKPLADVFLRQCRDTFSGMVQKKKSELESTATKSVATIRQADAVLNIRQLRGADAESHLDDEESFEASDGPEMTFSHRLSRVKQLTGFSDPVYAEACVTVHKFDILLDILIINQTPNTLQNLTLEIAASGDLRLVERPQPFTLAPHDFHKMRASLKVSSTDNGIIFGNIVFDESASGIDKKIIVMSSINMDIMDYISPATCSSQKFSDMWAEFEWENKVPVNTDIRDLTEYLHHIVSITNMKCLTPEVTLAGKTPFLAANLYARSIFGEDSLLNLSVEYTKSGKIGGYIRIRSKTQGIALSLGDKITSAQRMSS